MLLILKMHLRNGLFAVIIFSILISKITCTLECCKNNGTLRDLRKCADGTSPNVTCDGYTIILNPNWGVYSSFFIAEDDDGDYLDAFIAGYFIRRPYFCTGNIFYSMLNRTSSVAVVCSSYRNWYSDVKLNGSAEAKKEAKFVRIYELFTTLLNCASALAFSVTAAIYFFLPEVQDLQGKCYFHLTFIAAMAHLGIEYKEIFDTDGILPDMCITNAYLEIYLILTGFMWNGVVCYNTWRHTRNIHSKKNDEELHRIYIYVAYGAPLALLFLCWIHVHIENMSTYFFVLDCYAHQGTLYTFYVALPILLILLFNFVMFVDAQIQVWNSHAVDLRNTGLAFNILKYRLFMNMKLFFLMGTPWAIFILVQLLDELAFHSSFMNYLEKFLLLLLFGEGVPIFLILVLFRKRVPRGMANRWLTNTNIFPEKWKTVRDSETEEESEEDETERADTNIQVRYSPQNDDEDKFNHNPTSIITF